MFQSMRDKTLSHAAKIAINSQIEAYGQVQRLNLDSKKKSIELEVLLHGEIEAFKVHVDHYELIEVDGRHQLKVHRVTTSRAWINTIASTHLEGRMFNVPDKYGKILKEFI
ncbi:MAG: hypothetical protein U9R27_00570 [Campylobacterota bacterium]|nr:hypothetical protein [Campylobacterota bacterium]